MDLTRTTLTSGRPAIILGQNDGASRKAIAARIQALGYELCEAANASALIQAIVAACFGPAGASRTTVVVADLQPSRSALDALRMLRDHPACPNLVFVASSTDVELRKEAHQLGALAVLDKPLEVETLLSVIVGHVPPES